MFFEKIFAGVFGADITPSFIQQNCGIESSESGEQGSFGLCFPY